MLGAPREAGRPASGRPTLSEADRLLESARGSGAKVDAEVTGALETVPGPVSREGYRILQESLTNVLGTRGACRCGSVSRSTTALWAWRSAIR